MVLSEQPGVFKEVIIRESQNSYTRLRFKEVKLNAKMNPDVFAALK